MKPRSTTQDEDKVIRFLYEADQKEWQPTFADICGGTGLTKVEARRALTGLEEKGLAQGPPSLVKKTQEVMKGIEPKFGPTNRGYAEHLILLASAIAKADESFLADELGFEQEFVGLVGARLRAGGIWSADQISEKHRSSWMEDDGGDIAFFMDGAVATGDLMIVGENDKGSPLYQQTPGGKAHAESLLKRPRA